MTVDFPDDESPTKTRVTLEESSELSGDEAMVAMRRSGRELKAVRPAEGQSSISNETALNRPTGVKLFIA